MRGAIHPLNVIGRRDRLNDSLLRSIEQSER